MLPHNSNAPTVGKPSHVWRSHSSHNTIVTQTPISVLFNSSLLNPNFNLDFHALQAYNNSQHAPAPSHKCGSDLSHFHTQPNGETTPRLNPTWLGAVEKGSNLDSWSRSVSSETWSKFHQILTKANAAYKDYQAVAILAQERSQGNESDGLFATDTQCRPVEPQLPHMRTGVQARSQTTICSSQTLSAGKERHLVCSCNAISFPARPN